MPTIPRKTRTFSDISLLFGINAFTKDIQRKNDEEAVKASIRHLILTQNYERPFHPEIGCQVYGLLFEPFDPITAELMKRTISNVITAYEPRVDLLNVRIRDLVDENSIEATVEFRIKNSDRPLTVTTAVTRVR